MASAFSNPDLGVGRKASQSRLWDGGEGDACETTLCLSTSRFLNFEDFSLRLSGGKELKNLLNRLICSAIFCFELRVG
jgi:hypothetical protein